MNQVSKGHLPSRYLDSQRSEFTGISLHKIETAGDKSIRIVCCKISSTQSFP